jgi:hypothetical protein
MDVLALHGNLDEHIYGIALVSVDLSWASKDPTYVPLGLQAIHDP